MRFWWISLISLMVVLATIATQVMYNAQRRSLARYYLRGLVTPRMVPNGCRRDWIRISTVLIFVCLGSYTPFSFDTGWPMLINISVLLGVIAYWWRQPKHRTTFESTFSTSIHD
jgi:hypothetical protein